MSELVRWIWLSESEIALSPILSIIVNDDSMEPHDDGSVCPLPWSGKFVKHLPTLGLFGIEISVVPLFVR